MTKLNIYLLAGISCLLAANSTVAAASLTLNNDIDGKVVAYSKNGKLYKYEMYIAHSKTPVLVSRMSSDTIPSDVQITTYPTLRAFDQEQSKHTKIQSYAGDGVKIAFGYIPSIQKFYDGVGPDSCYISDPTVDRGNNIAMQSQLIATSADSADSSMMSNDTSVQAAFEEFKSKADNTFSKNYAGAVDTGEYNLAAAVTTIVNTNIPAKNNLTPNGIDKLENPLQFLNSCGSSGISAFIAGILTTVNIKVITTSHTASNNFSNSVSAGWGPVDVSNAFQSGKNNAEDFKQVNITVNKLGNIKFNEPHNGVNDYDSYIQKAMDAALPDLVKCQTTQNEKTSQRPDLTACANYITNISTAINEGIRYAKAAISEPPSGSDKKSFGADTLYKFPNGLNFSHNSGKTMPSYKDPTGDGAKITYYPANNNGKNIEDPFKTSNVATYLQNAIRLVYQLNALSARALLLASQPSVTTPDEVIFLQDLASLYSLDALDILRVSNGCFDGIFKANSSNIPECKKTISIANDAEKFKLSELPSYVLKLYSKDFPDTKSLQELLFQNALALQYDVGYTEIATAVAKKAAKCSKNSCGIVRIGNQIGFGLAFYNASRYSTEFFGGAKNVGPQVAGYIFPTTITPKLGLGQSVTYTNDGPGGGTNRGVQWWQQHKDELPQNQEQEYEAAPLYFVFNHPQLLPTGFEQSKMVVNSALPFPIGPEGVFNKIIARNGYYTGDSSAAQNGRVQTLVKDGSYSPPSIKELIAGGELPTPIYNFSGVATTLDPNATQCFNGVYVPHMRYPGKDKRGQLVNNSTYGSLNAKRYFCNANPSSKDTWSNFIFENSSDMITVSNMKVNKTFILNPIKNFFGLPITTN